MRGLDTGMNTVTAAREQNAVERIFNTLESLTHLSQDILRREITTADALLGSMPCPLEKDGIHPTPPGVIHQIQVQLDNLKITLNKVHDEQQRYLNMVAA